MGCLFRISLFAARPGLPLLPLGRAERRRQPRVQLVCRLERHPRPGVVFPFAVPRSQPLGLPRSRFSVALPLGINAAGPRWAMGRSYPNNWLPLPYFGLTLAGRTPGWYRNFRREAAYCGPAPAHGRPARLCESQEHYPPFMRNLPFGFGLRAPRVGRRPSAQTRRFYEPQKHSSFNYSNSARFVLGAPPRDPKASPDSAHSCWARQQFAASGEQQRAPTSCSPPRGVTTNCAALRAARAQSIHRPVFRFRAARSEGGPKAQRAGPAVLRTAKAQPHTPPEEQAQPKARPSSRPCVRLTAAPLALRRVFARLRDSSTFG